MRWLLLLATLFLSACNSDKIAQLEKKINELSAKVESLSKQANLDQQGQCAKQARGTFEEGGWKEKDYFASYTNHYNVRLGKCFILTNNIGVKSPSRTQILSDAFEGKTYGNYLWLNPERKKYDEVPPFECEITPPSGSATKCATSDEFDQLVKPYMEE